MLLLIDGHSLAHRSYHGFIRSADLHGRGAVYGFFHNVLNLASTYKPTHMVVAWDSDQLTWRHRRYPEYKAGRDEKPGDLVTQIEQIKKGVKALEIAQLEFPGWEADDWIGSTIGHFNTNRSGFWPQIRVYSSDKDLYQLVTPCVKILSPGDKRIKEVDQDGVQVSLGVSPKQVPDFKALSGDSSDNLPGVTGIGPKIAASLLSKYENLEQIYENLGDQPEGIRNRLATSKDMAFLCKHLAKIVTNIPLPADIDLALKPPAFNQGSDYFREVRLSKLSEKVAFSFGYLYAKKSEPIAVCESLT